jgi:alkylation response protein AidB-like acyl-CoA dehydrogenase
MNFDLSDEQRMLRDQARRFLDEKGSPDAARAILEGDDPFDSDLWTGMANLGWMATAIPEAYGGAGLSHEELCVIAEELGRAMAPTPFSSSIYLTAEAILLAGSEDQKQRYLPLLASGEKIGCVAVAEGVRRPGPADVSVRFENGVLNGEKLPVADGDVADFAIVLARTGGGDHDLSLVLADLDGVECTTVETVDPSRSHARIPFDGTPGELLGAAGDGWSVMERVFDRAAILFAFEQVGGAQACLDMATDYAKSRYAFGRPIGSFQAIKHKLADMYIALELARSNALYGAWALANDAPDLPTAAAAARVAAIQAFALASKENIQTHGGMGYTWEVDAQLYYRRAALLAQAVGGERRWKDKLITRLETRNVA